jgi:hypothetical protein
LTSWLQFYRDWQKVSRTDRKWLVVSPDVRQTIFPFRHLCIIHINYMYHYTCTIYNLTTIGKVVVHESWVQYPNVPKIFLGVCVCPILWCVIAFPTGLTRSMIMTVRYWCHLTHVPVLVILTWF